MQYHIDHAIGLKIASRDAGLPSHSALNLSWITAPVTVNFHRLLDCYPTSA
jgi:hypothetical protein